MKGSCAETLEAASTLQKYAFTVIDLGPFIIRKGEVEISARGLLDFL